ncbi:FAD-binding oxidoreductase [Streptomyces albiaxialis]|uniref:FAD-binding oxidoreductase n=1 Tax=Streptomyces albiaxialis TaxID=329523 RepID=A0ABN2VQW9_9ACTN
MTTGKTGPTGPTRAAGTTGTTGAAGTDASLGDALRAAVRGPVVVRGDDGFDDARRPWNLAVDQPVAAVVEPLDADDAAAAVRFAARTGHPLLPQPSGHGASGDAADALLLRTHRMDDVTLDPVRRTARVGAGAKWGQVLTAADPYGLTGLAGSSPVVSVAGYALGGGLSWFGRAHGFAAHSVRALDVVDATGTARHVTAESDPELFWALRGGGGDHALVTALEIDLVPAPELYGGALLWPGAAAPDVLGAYREVTAAAPDALTVWFSLVHFPGAEPMTAVHATYLGPPEEGAALLRPFERAGGTLTDSRGALSPARLGSVTAEPTAPQSGLSSAELLTELTDEAAEALLARPIEPLLNVQLRHLGGALARPPADAGTEAGACGVLTEPYLLSTYGRVPDPGAAAGVRERQAELARDLRPYLTGRKPYTYLSPGESAAAAFPAPALARLRALKRERDPRGVFRANAPVLGPPSPLGSAPR